MQKPGSEETAIHNLFTREIRPIHNWHEWLERWQAASTLEEMLGLLHVGFNVPLQRFHYEEREYFTTDRLIFYFSIADGWDDSYSLQVTEDEGKEYGFGRDRGQVIWKLPCELRQYIARKAFDMICQNFFKVVELMENGIDEFANIWERVVVTEPLFSVIKNFFRVEERVSGGTGIRNLSRYGDRSHNEKQAINFLLNLVRFICGWKEREIHAWDARKEKKEAENVAMRIRLDTSKPWMVEVLSQLGELNLLRKWILELDKPCLAKLKEIALRNEISNFYHPVRKTRRVATLDEACFVGSPAAWFLKEYELKKREHKRLSAISEAELRREEEGRKIKRLIKA